MWLWIKQCKWQIQWVHFNPLELLNTLTAWASAQLCLTEPGTALSQGCLLLALICTLLFWPVKWPSWKVVFVVIKTHTNSFKVVWMHPAYGPSRFYPFLTAYGHSTWEPAAWSTAVVLFHTGSPPSQASAVAQTCPPFNRAVCRYLPVPWVVWAFKTYPAQPCCLLLLSWGRCCPMFQRCQKYYSQFSIFPKSPEWRFFINPPSILEKKSVHVPTSTVKANSVNKDEPEYAQHPAPGIQDMRQHNS